MITQEHLRTLRARAQSLWQPAFSYSSSSHFLSCVDHALRVARAYLAPYGIYLLICALFCVVATLYAVFPLFRARTSQKSQSRKLLQAVLYVMTPTRSVWPQHYITAAKRAASSQDTTLRLSLRNMVDDVLSGRMELRAPQEDLADLLRNALKVDDWTLGLHIDRSWRFDLMGWVLAAQFAPSKSKVCVTEYQRCFTMRLNLNAECISRACCRLVDTRALFNENLTESRTYVSAVADFGHQIRGTSLDF